MLRTHAITVYCIAKVVNFPQSATTYLYWGRAAEPIAENGMREAYMAVSCLPVCFAHGDSPHGFGAQRNKRPPERGSRLSCVSYRNAYSLRGVTLT